MPFLMQPLFQAFSILFGQKVEQPSEVDEDKKRAIDIRPVVEKEEGEWSDADGSADNDYIICNA